MDYDIALFSEGEEQLLRTNYGTGIDEEAILTIDDTFTGDDSQYIYIKIINYVGDSFEPWELTVFAGN